MDTATELTGSLSTDPRQRIIEAARNLFLQRGFSKATTDSIARQLGISKKTIYRHFATKDELLEAALEWQMLIIKNHLNDIVNRPDTDFLDRLYEHFTFIAGMLARFKPAFLDDLRRHRPDLWKRIEAFRRANLQTYFGKLVAEGRRLGIIRNEVDDRLFIQIYLAAIQGTINPEAIASHGYAADKVFRGIAGVMFEGILSDGARPLFRGRFSSAGAK